MVPTSQMIENVRQKLAQFGFVADEAQARDIVESVLSARRSRPKGRKARNLRSLITRYQVKQAALVRVTGITPSHMSRVLSCSAGLTTEHAATIAAYLSTLTPRTVTPEELYLDPSTQPKVRVWRDTDNKITREEPIVESDTPPALDYLALRERGAPVDPLYQAQGFGPVSSAG